MPRHPEPLDRRPREGRQSPGQSEASRGSVGRWTLLIIATGVSVGPLDSACNIAFPAIVTAFNVPVAAIRWVVIAYVLTYASLLLGFGRLGDLFGHRRLFVLGLFWSAGAFALCAWAPNFGWLLAARILQGVGAAMVLSCGPALATLSFPAEHRAQVLGLYMFAFSAAHAAGPIVGALLVDAYGWPAVFWFRVPIALGSAVLVLGILRAAPAPVVREPYDTPGAVALACALACLLLFMNLASSHGLGSPAALSALLLGCLGAGLFVARNRRGQAALIDLSLFRSRAFCAVNAAHVLANLAHFIVFLLVPFFLVDVHGVPIALGGLLLAHQPIGMALAAPIAGRLVPRLGAVRVGFAGMLISGSGLAAIVGWSDSTLLPALALTLLVQGFGYGLFQVASIDAVMAALGRHRHGVGGSLNMLTRTIGVVLGATAGSLLFSHWSGPEGASAPGFQKTFVVATGVAFLAAAAVALARRQSSARGSAPQR
ncbi:MAG: MFS transporter [Gammaproteobacteria bacterium]